jgi:hypothetical protein
MHMSPESVRPRTAPRVARRLASLVLLAALGCAQAPWAHRFGHPVHVSEVVALSQHGVPPDRIIAKMNRGGLVYHLSDQEYADLRKRGVTPQVIAYMKGTYAQAAAKFPKIAKDPHYGCWYLGPDGHWYGGGPEGFHPDC